MSPPRPTSTGLPRPFLILLAATSLLALAAAATFAVTQPLHTGRPVLFGVLAAFVLVGEMLPIPVPQRTGLDESVTVSAAFALALLALFGPLPAIIVYALSVVAADLRARVMALKVAFNVSQYVLSLGAGAAVLVLGGVTFPVDLASGANIALVLVACITSFVTNHVLSCLGGALVSRYSLWRYLSEDIGFQAWTAGIVIAFAPAVMTAAERNLALVPLSFLPMIAIYIGGRQASVSAYRASHDALTDLPNRSFLATRLHGAIAEASRAGGEISVMIIDLNDFKAINDTLGHDIGDLVLIKIAERLERALAGLATLGRLGGDEFAVVVPGDRETAERCAQLMLSEIAAPLPVESLALEVSGSVGIACFPRHGKEAQELLRHADVALYCAKEQDRGYELYTRERDDYTIDRLVLASQLRRGIERDELEVHYQPKVPLSGGPTRGVEALVRWNHPQLGRIGPDGFIPLAEQSGLIKPLTAKVMEVAVRQSRAWLAAGLDVRVSVNVSTKSLLDHDLPSMITRLLEVHDLAPDYLQLEITESRIVTDVGRARAVLDELRSAGVSIAIDDFGTGFSSLSQLQQLPVDEIKIDRSFVARMDTVQADELLVRSIVDLGRNLGLRVTAEGVESEETMRNLRALGCDFAQGYHLGVPVVADECQRRYLRPVAPDPSVVELPLRGVATA